jgi:hypothetical protein
MSELYNRPIEVYVPSNGVRPINIFQSGYHAPRDDRAGPSGAGTAAGGVDRRPAMEEDEGDGDGDGGAIAGGAIAGDVPIRLCYTNGEHYDALIDPMLPTAGLGLGLPGLRVGLADRMQLEEAKEASLVEGAILEEAKNASMMDDERMRTALEDSRRALIEREEMEIGEALRASGGGGKSSPSSSYDVMFEKKAMYLSEMEAADFDLEQAVKCGVCSFFLFLASLAIPRSFYIVFPSKWIPILNISRMILPSLPPTLPRDVIRFVSFLLSLPRSWRVRWKPTGNRSKSASRPRRGEGWGGRWDRWEGGRAEEASSAAAGTGSAPPRREV